MTRARLEKGAIRSKCLAYRVNMHTKSIILDYRLSPDPSGKIFLANELPGELSKKFDNLECTRTEWKRTAMQTELAPLGVDLPRSGVVDRQT